MPVISFGDILNVTGSTSAKTGTAFSRETTPAVAKKEYGGIDRIRDQTGINVQRILDVSVAGDKTQVTYDRYKEVE